MHSPKRCLHEHHIHLSIRIVLWTKDLFVPTVAIATFGDVWEEHARRSRVTGATGESAQFRAVLYPSRGQHYRKPTVL